MKRKIISAILRGASGINLDRNKDGKISFAEVVEAVISLGTTVLSILYLGK